MIPITILLCTMHWVAVMVAPGKFNQSKNNQPYHLRVITISDMVRVQRKLIEALDIATIKMVIGGSMGCRLEWVAQVPDMIKSCVPVASTIRLAHLLLHLIRWPSFHFRAVKVRKW